MPIRRKKTRLQKGPSNQVNNNYSYWPLLKRSQVVPFKALNDIDGDSFKKLFTDVAGLSSANVSPICEDKAGNIWIASMNFGVYRYDGNKLVLFNETDRKELTVNLCVQSILQDSKGTMWFGFSGGLFRLKGSSFANVTKDGPWK